MPAAAGPVALAGLIALFLALFLVVPVVTVIYVAFTEKGSGAFTLINFYDFARTDLFITSFWNSIYVAAMTVALASLFALPLAYLTTRFEFRGAGVVQTLGLLPLIMPPFVGAVAMQLLFGRNGTFNLLLDDWLGFKIPFMEGLNGVIFVAGRALLSVHPDQSVRRAAQHRPVDGGGRAEPRRARIPAVPPDRVPACHAGLYRRREPGVRQGVRRPRDAAAAERQGHAGAAGIPAHHLDRHRRSDGLRHLPSC